LGAFYFFSGKKIDPRALVNIVATFAAHSRQKTPEAFISTRGDACKIVREKKIICKHALTLIFHYIKNTP
jgi:hypothetical protein